MTDQDALIDWLAEVSHDPLAFALGGFPWSEANGPLANRQLEEWQYNLLCNVRDGLLTPEEAIREATVSGNGVGKSAVVCILILFLHCTREDTKGIVTANTETQLKTKTWAELGKWFNMFIAKELFRMTATALLSRDPDRERTWRTDMVPWSEHNVVAFQGLHNEGKRLFIIFDEASGIDDGIWEAGDGCMTDAGTERVWLVFGNPNSPKGRFRDCFPGGRFAARWHSRKIDSRSVSFTDKAEFQKWIDDYGEDNDFVRVRVRGEFPRVGTIQFISDTLAREAADRTDAPVHLHDPLVIGVDVARFGDDASVIYFRKGRDGRTIPPLLFRGVDTMTLAGHVSQAYTEYRADAVFVDGTGVGGGVVDRLRQLRVPCIDINFGSKSDTDGFAGDQPGTKYANKRAEMWGGLRDWLKGGAIPNDPQLVEELSSPQYAFNVRNEIQLEKKEDMKKRGRSSPDIADALALTFAYPVQASAAAGGPYPGKPMHEFEYNPFGPEVFAEASA